jgi:hypothetical protein
VDTFSVGNADTGAIHLLPAIYKRWPQARYIFIIRDLEDIAASLSRIGLSSQAVPMMNDFLWWGISYIEGAITVRFDELFNQVSLRKIWKHAGIQDEFPWQRAELLRNMQVEDGFGAGFGRFKNKELIKENRSKFNALMQSVKKDLPTPEERRMPDGN